LINCKVKDLTFGKILSLYLNSTIALLQLIAFLAETRGAWVDLHARQEWGQIHVPNINKLRQDMVDRALNTFKEVSKINVKTLYQRIKAHDNVQRRIDELALELLGLDNWKHKLDELYDAVANELETMQKILETSKRTRQTRRKK